MTQVARPEHGLNISLTMLVPIHKIECQNIFALLTQQLLHFQLSRPIWVKELHGLQTYINAVELAIIANSIALGTVLKAACTARVHYSS